MRLSQVVIASAALLGALFFSGCATVTRGVHEALVIESEPGGAKIQLSNGLTGTTPTSFKVARKGDIVATISKEGYETATVNITTQVAGAGAAGMAGNVLVGGIIGVGVDAWSGGMLEHKPNPVHVVLTPLKVAAAAPAAPVKEEAHKPAEKEPAAAAEAPAPAPASAPAAASPAGK